MKFKGFIAAPFTAFKKNGSVNLSIIPEYYQYLVNHGVQGAFINGTTGEGLSLSGNERMTLTEAWMQAAYPDFKIIVNVGANDENSIMEMSAHAQQVEADGIAMLVPGFFKPAKVEQLVTICSRMAEKAPDCDVYYYHIPALTGVRLSMYEFMKEAVFRIPNFKGLKYSDPNFFELHQICEDFGKQYDIFFGCDELLIYGLLAGANGAVGSTYNYMCSTYRRIVDAYYNKNLTKARRLQSDVIAFVDSLHQYGGGVMAGKALMSQISGIDFGDCRMPLATLNGISKKEWFKELKEMGVMK